MILSSYTLHKKAFPEIDDLQCHTNYGKGYELFRNRVVYIYIYIYIDQPAKVIVGRCLMDFTRFLLLYHMLKNALSTISIS